MPINEELKQKTEQFRQQVKDKLEEHKRMFEETNDRNNKNVDEMAEVLQTITIDALKQTFPYTKTVTIKQDYITNEAWEMIASRQKRWKDILNHAINPTVKNFCNFKLRTFQAMRLFAKWHKEKRETQKNLHEAKRKHLDDALKKVSEGNSLQAIRDRHKLLRQFAPKPKGQMQQIKSKNRKYTHNRTRNTSS